MVCCKWGKQGVGYVVQRFWKRHFTKAMASPMFTKDQAWEKYVHFPRRVPPVRPWVVTSQPIVTGQRKLDFFSLATYNMLAQSLLEEHTRELYRHCPPQFLEWEYRKQGLLALLTGCYADVLCLQEVEERHYEDTFLPHLRQHGFDGIYQKRTGTYTDGCAIFYRCALFELVEYKKVQYLNSDKCPILNRHNVGLVVKLRAKGESPSEEQEINSGDVKLAQTAILLAELYRMCQAPNGTLCASVLCGDFNCLPNSPLQLLITNSKLQYEDLCASEIAGYSKRKNRKLPIPLLSPKLGIADNCTFVPLDQISSELNSSDNKNQSTSCSIQQDSKSKVLTNGHNKDVVPVIDLTMDNGSPDKSLPVIDLTDDSEPPHDTIDKNQELASAAPKATLSHGFKFESVYKVIEGVQPASVTTFHCSAMEMVDYIYFTPASLVQSNNSSSLHLLSRCALPSTSTLMELGPLPNEFLPSDHLHLQAQFQLLTH